jgi:alpha-tubulin suppressor-like RCC1 family protein/ligand-binding sensor domain-containing protein
LVDVGFGTSAIRGVSSDINGMVYIGGASGKFAISDDFGATWSSLVDVGFGTSIINEISSDINGNIYVGGAGGKFTTSDDFGATWSSLVDVGFGTDYIYSISSDINGNVYIGGDDGKFVISDDFGATFGSLVDVGFGTSAIRGVSSDINGMVYIGGASGKFAISDDFGAIFGSLVDIGFETNSINIISCDINGNVYVGGGDGYFVLSTDFGSTWSIIVIEFLSNPVYSASSDVNGNVYIGGQAGYYTRSIANLTPPTADYPLQIKFQNDLTTAIKEALEDTSLFTVDSQLLLKTVDVGFGALTVFTVASCAGGKYIYIAGEDGSFAVSANYGITWSSLIDVGFGTSDIFAISCDNVGNVYIGGQAGKFAVSDDFGATWSSLIDIGFDSSDIVSISSDINGTVYIGGVLGKFVISTDFGSTFGSLVDVGFGTSIIRGVSSDINGIVYVGGAGGKFTTSDDFGATWSSLVDVGFGTSSINSVSSDINGMVYVAGESGKFVISDDFGATFGSLVDVGFGTSLILSVVSDIAGNVYVGGLSGKFAISDDFGATWSSLIDVGFGSSFIWGIALSSDYSTYYIVGDAGLFRGQFTDLFLTATFSGPVDVPDELDSTMTITRTVQGFSPNVDPLIYMTLGTPLSIAYLYDVEVDEDWSLGIFESGVFKGSIPVPQSAFSLFALERDGTDFRMRVGADSVLFTLAYTGGSSNLVINLYEDFSYVIDEILWYNDAIDSDLVNQYIGAEIPWSEGIDFEKDLIIAPAEDEGRIHLIGEVVSQSITEQIGEVISERSKITRLIAETSYVSNGIMYDSVDVITFGRRTNVYGGTLNGENGGDTYSSPYLLLKPIQETGTLIQVDMWAHGGCALYSTGNFYTCGYNNIGQLGFGDTTHRAILTLVTTDVTEYRRPACMSYDHNDWRLLVKKSDNYWYGVGYNANGALGLGDTTHRTTFTQLTALGTDVREVWNLGTTYGCVVVQQNDGTTLIAGFNGQGHFGIGSATAINHTWIDITSDWGITGSDQILDVLGVFGYFDSGVSSSSSMIMLISDNQVYGRVRTCGTNTWGSLGDTTTTTRTTPIAPTGVPDTIIKIQYAGGGPASAYALTNANVLWDWGHNGNGQLGIGSTSNQPTPQSRSNTKNIFARAYAHTYSYSNQAFIIDTNDELWAAGHNSNGQLGNGNQTLQTSWVRIPYDTRYGNIIDAKWNGYDSGGYYIMFLTDAGFVFGVGYNGRYGLSLTGEANSKLALTRLNFGII